MWWEEKWDIGGKIYLSPAPNRLQSAGREKKGFYFVRHSKGLWKQK